MHTLSCTAGALVEPDAALEATMTSSYRSLRRVFPVFVGEPTISTSSTLRTSTAFLSTRSKASEDAVSMVRALQFRESTLRCCHCRRRSGTWTRSGRMQAVVNTLNTRSRLSLLLHRRHLWIRGGYKWRGDAGQPILELLLGRLLATMYWPNVERGHGNVSFLNNVYGFHGS